MLALPQKSSTTILLEPSLRLSHVSQNLFFVLCAYAHDDANAILQAQAANQRCAALR